MWTKPNVAPWQRVTVCDESLERSLMVNSLRYFQFQTEHALLSLWDGTYKRISHEVAVAGFSSSYLKGPWPYVRHHITVDVLGALLNKTFRPCQCGISCMDTISSQFQSNRVFTSYFLWNVFTFLFRTILFHYD